MDLDLTISNREIKPQVVKVFQYENETTTLTFTLDSYTYGEVDLRNYKAYGITSINGEIDMTELETSIVDNKLILTWDVQEYSLRQEGAILYQICFKENADDGENTAVFYSYKAIMLNRGSVDADNHITANYPTILKQWLDRMNTTNAELETELTAKIDALVDQYPYTVVTVAYGETLPTSERLAGHLYWFWEDEAQTKGHFEDNEGNVLTDNNEKLEYLLNDKDFEIKALYEFHNRDLTHLTVDTFEDLSGIVDLPNEYVIYDTDKHVFTKNGLEGQTLQFTDIDTSSYSTIWVSVDWVDLHPGVTSLEIVLVTGATETVLTNNEETTIVGDTNSYIKLNLSGYPELKNIAWGLK